MQEHTTKEIFEYRQEVVLRFFNLIKSSESGYVISGISTGKTRLIDYMMRADVQNHYLGEDAKSTLLVSVDTNLVSNWSDLGFHELLLNSLMLACGRKPELNLFQEEFARLDTQIIIQQNELLASRFLGLAIQKVCQTHKICFILDEFDSAYKHLSQSAFVSLRGFRDANKYRLSYIMFLRQIPSNIRSPNDNESFFELISRNLIGLGPYTQRDTLRIIQQIEVRRALSLTADQREWLYEISGGHIGLVQALLTLSIEGLINCDQQETLARVVKQNVIHEECNKIWESLQSAEQIGLIQFEDLHQVESSAIEKLLLAKGLLRKTGDHFEIFSPLFRIFIKNVPIPNGNITLAKRMLKVFLCHSSQNKPFVRMLYQRLNSLHGLSLWLDENNLLPGDDWNYEITKAIEETDVVIVCISRSSTSKEGYIQKEIKHVLDMADEKPEGTIFVIPVKIEECDIPRRLSQWHWLNYSDDGAFERLILSLKKRAQHLGIDVGDNQGHVI